MLGIYRQKLFYLGDRPFNLQGEAMVFFSFKIFFFGQHESSNIYFFCRAKREFFFRNLTLGYMTKTLNQIIFCSSTKIRIFFQQHWESEFFFLEKKTYPPPPPPFKLNGRSLTINVLSL